MAKKKKARNQTDLYRESMRRAHHEAYVEAMREGRRERAQTFEDRRKRADRDACRGRHNPED